MFDNIVDFIIGTPKSANRKIEEIIFFIICVALLVFAMVDMMMNSDWEDLANYFYDANMFFDGNMPYRDYVFEYPPMAFLFMLIPRIFCGDIAGYSLISSVIAGVCFLICAHYLLKMADEFKISYRLVMILLILTLLFASTFVTRRNDVIAAMLIIIALWMYFKTEYVGAFIIIALAGLLKMYPLLLLIPMLLPFAIKKDQFLSGVKYLAVAILTCVIIELPFLISDPSTAFDYLTYHSDRGVQVESVAGGIIMLGNILFPGDLSVVHNYGSHNLAGAIPDAIAPFMNVFLAISLVIFVCWLVWKLYNDSDNENHKKIMIIFALEALLLIFITFSKVYSAQYMIWIMTLFPLLMLPDINKERKIILMAIFIPFGILSMMNGSFTYDALIHMELDGIMIIFVRNVLHIVLMVYIIWIMYKTTKDSGVADQSNEPICSDAISL